MSASSLWRRGVRLLSSASGSSLFGTSAKSRTSQREALGPGPQRSPGPRPGLAKEKPSYLSAEIAKMKKAYEKYNETPPKPFKLRGSGELDLVLTRRKGLEDIQVKCELFFHPRGGSPDELALDELDDEEGREQKVVVNITLTITKGGPETLEMNVDCDRKGFIVNHILYLENKGMKNDDDYFPAFWRIGPSLRTEFYNFLEARGLDERFACWVHDQMDDKAFRERLRHMEKINAFLENKKQQQ